MTIGMNLTSWFSTLYREICFTDDRLNLSTETKNRPSQRAGKTYSAVQKNLEVV